MLQVKNLSVGYQKTLLERLDLALEKHELWALIGRNGSGKTTLLRTLSGVMSPMEGEIFINNQRLNRLTTKELAHQISIVTTDRVQLSYFKVVEVLKLGRQPYTNSFGQLTEEDNEVIDRVIGQLSLTKLLAKTMNQLSDGERQQVMIGRALVQDTPLILLDEPTAHLDLVNRYHIFNSLKKLDKTVLVATHELEMALQIADNILLLDGNGKYYKGTPSELINNKCIEQVFGQEFLDFDAKQGRFYLKT